MCAVLCLCVAVFAVLPDALYVLRFSAFTKFHEFNRRLVALPYSTSDSFFSVTRRVLFTRRICRCSTCFVCSRSFFVTRLLRLYSTLLEVLDFVLFNRLRDRNSTSLLLLLDFVFSLLDFVLVTRRLRLDWTSCCVTRLPFSSLNSFDVTLLPFLYSTPVSLLDFCFF